MTARRHPVAPAARPATAVPARPLDPRTRRMLEGPIVPTLLRLAVPNVVLMLVQASVGLIEVWFIGFLGTDALAGASLVFPVLMLMQTMSAGGMGGGIASAVARAIGGGRRDDADALATHAVVIAVAFGLFFTLVLLAAGPWLYATMGGRGASLDAALAYSTVTFGGAVLVWLFNSLSNVIRGTGDMATPAIVSTAGAVFVVPISPLLIFGWGPVPALGVAGGAVALLAFYALGTLALVVHLRSARSLVRLPLAGVRLHWRLFRDILRVGAFGVLITFQTNLAIIVATGFVGRFGPAAIAGYGVGARLEYLLIPLVFGLGAPLVAMVGTCIGAGRPARALRIAWLGAVLAFAITETIGLVAAAFPQAWLTLFDTDPAMLAAGTRYLQAVGPFYGMFGLGLALYFGSQGAGRMLWPLIANIARLVIVAGGGWLVLRHGGDLVHLFAVLAAALVALGLINAAAVAGGAWTRQPAADRPHPHR